MQMPRPGAEHERLALLEGEWEGDERIHPTPFDPEGGPAHGTWRARMALGGFCLIADYEQRRGGSVNFEGFSRQLYEVSGDTFRFGLETSTDGVEWLTFLEGEYHRR
jgi:hypothetical protein